MDIRIFPQKLGGSLEAIPSKSHSHRLLLAAALADKPSVITLSEICDDINSTVTALQNLGMEWQPLGNNRFQITPIKEVPDNITLDCGSSGTTLRFLLPAVAAPGGNHIVFTGSEQLTKRPLEDLLSTLKNHGVTVNGKALPLTLSGALTGGNFTLPGNISSQYISGLLFALPLLKEDSTVTLTSPLESAPYIELTVEVLKQFGISVQREAFGFSCRGRQRYRSPESLLPEGDWSNAAFWLAAGAIGKEISLKGLALDSYQGDKAITEILKQAGGTITTAANTIAVAPSSLSGFSVDVAQIPDLAPISAVLGCAANGTTKIYGGSRLRLKESDRLYTVAENLSALGAEITETADGLIIHGGKPLQGGTVSAKGDHRLAMILTVAATLCKEPVILKEAETVAKSYPSFYSDYIKLGGRYDVL